MVKAHTFILMEINTQENGKTVKNMGKVHTIIPVDLNMKVNSKTVQWMVKESSPGTKV